MYNVHLIISCWDVEAFPNHDVVLSIPNVLSSLNLPYVYARYGSLKMQKQSDTSVAPWVFSCETLRDPKNPLVLTITFTIKMGPEGPPLHFAKACWIPWSTGYPHDFPIKNPYDIRYPPVSTLPADKVEPSRNCAKTFPPTATFAGFIYAPISQIYV